MTAISESQHARFYIHNKQKKLRNGFLYKKPDTFQKLDNFRYVFIYKKPYTLGYEIFHEIFEVVIYIQKAWHFALRDVLYTKS